MDITTTQSPRAEPPPTRSEVEWRAFWTIGQIKEIASPGFADRVALAHAEGLLAPMPAGDQGAVQTRASECIAALSAQIRWVYPQVRTDTSTLEVCRPEFPARAPDASSDTA